MIRLTSELHIGDHEFKGVVSATIESSWDNLTDTAEIVFPRKIKWKGRELTLGRDPIIKKGDKVILKLGYDDKNNDVFNGFVTAIDANIPASVKCEDAMWHLKQGTFTKAYKKVTLKQLLQDLLTSDYAFEAPDIDLGPFRINKATPAQVLEHLKSTYALKSFFRNGKLYVGLAYWPELQKVHKIRFNRNVTDHNLTFINKDDVKIKLNVIVINDSNEKKEYTYGDEDGEVRTLHYYNIDKAQVDHIASQELDRLRYDGYRGGLTIFGAPQVQHGDVVELYDDFYPERDGRYLVKGVTPDFGNGGYRQTLELDSRI